MKEDVDRSAIFKSLNLKETSEKPALLMVIDSFKKGENLTLNAYSPTSDDINKNIDFKKDMKKRLPMTG